MSKSITITGALGSGKSTVAKLVAQKLGFFYYSTGNAQRKIASEMGVTTLELNKLASEDKMIDEKIDSVFKEMNISKTPYVVDSRLAFFFMPHSFKIKLNVNSMVAAERIFADSVRLNESKYQSVSDVLKATTERRAHEVNRFFKTYGVNIEDENNFDLIINTTDKSIQAVVDEICVKYQKY